MSADNNEMKNRVLPLLLVLVVPSLAAAAARPQAAQDARAPGALADIGIATAPKGHTGEGVASLRQSLEMARQSGNLQAKNRKLERLPTQARLKDAEDAARRWRQRFWATLAAAAVLAALLLVSWLRRPHRAHRQLARNVARLSEQSSLDELTGVFNRRYFATLMQPDAGGEPVRVGLVMLEVDHFIRINDSLGEDAGDAVLVEVARRLQPIARSHDHVVRWGGEEFVLVLHDIAPHDLPLMARRLLDTVAKWPIHVGSDQVDISISAGCVVHPLGPGCAWEPALRLADAAMFHAKRHGRNRAVCVTAVNEPLARDVADGDLAAAVHSGALGITEVAGPARSAIHAGA